MRNIATRYSTALIAFGAILLLFFFVAAMMRAFWAASEARKELKEAVARCSTVPPVREITVIVTPTDAPEASPTARPRPTAVEEE